MLDEGLYTSVSEIGDAENISKSYVSRILRLALLSPDIIEMILEGRSDQAVLLEQLERPLSANWEEQRRRFALGFVCASDGIYEPHPKKPETSYPLR